MRDKSTEPVKSRTIECLSEVDGSQLKGALLILDSDKRVPDYLILVISDSFLDKYDPYLVDFLRYVYSKNFKFHFLDVSNQYDARRNYLAIENKIKGYYKDEEDLVIDKSNRIHDLHLVIKFKEYSEERFLKFQSNLEEATLKLEDQTKNIEKKSFIKRLKEFLNSLCR